MGLFSLTQELAIDLGTANTIIISNGKIVVDEPSIVALDQHTGKAMAIGKKARQMHGKTHQNIKTVRPLKDGVIADFNAAEIMLRGLIKMVKSNGRLFSPSLKMVICIPSGSTNVEIRAVRDSAEHAGGREVYMIYEPMAAALGAGLDVEAPEGNMVVDIGGGTTEIACISLGGIVCSESINVAGDVAGYWKWPVSVLMPVSRHVPMSFVISTPRPRIASYASRQQADSPPRMKFACP